MSTKVAIKICDKNSFINFRSLDFFMANLQLARQGDQKAKRKCLNVMYQGHPNDDGTIAQSKRLSRHFFFDIDDKNEAERVINAFKANPSNYNFHMVERSINGGLHIVAPREWGKTILESQCELSLLLHCEMDTNNHDAMRMCFSTSASSEDLIHVSDELFTDDFDEEKWQEEKAYIENKEEDLPEGAHGNDKHYKPWEHDWPSHNISVLSKEIECAEETQEVAPVISPTQKEVVRNFPDHYNNIPYSDIINKYWGMFHNGKTPTEGGRNSLTFELAVNMAPLCDYNKEWLEEVIPKYDGFPEAEWRETINSALKQPRKGITYRITKVLQALEEANKLAITGGSANRPPQMPKKLMRFHKVLTSCTPDIYKPTVCEAAFASLATHLSGVTFRYIDNKEHEPSFLSVLINDMSTGKGCIDQPIKYILKDIIESDNLSRNCEAEWKRKNPSSKSSREKRPDDICVQVLMSDTTNAAFNQRLADCNRNGGKRVYMKVDEIEEFYKLKTNGTTPTTLMKLAWDSAICGQERVGAESVSGTAPCRWNFNASTTPSRGRRFFGPYVNDGTLSRLTLNTIDIQEGNDDIPIFKKYTDKYEKALKPFIENLKKAKGEISCKKAEQLARDMDKENKELASVYDSKAYKILSYRANVDAYKKSMILFIINGCKWSKDIENYVRWSLKWDLWTKLRYFGDLLEKAIDEDLKAINPGPQNLLAQLPDRFTEEELNQCRLKAGKNGSSKSLIRQWKHRGYIEFDDTTNEYVKVGKYANK